MQTRHSILLFLFLTVSCLSATPRTIGVVGLKICGKDFLFIDEVLPEMPAAKAGIQKGDYLLRIDNEETKTCSFDDVLSRLRGAPGTTVLVTIKRALDGKVVDVTLTRTAMMVNEPMPSKDVDLAP